MRIRDVLLKRWAHVSIGDESSTIPIDDQSYLGVPILKGDEAMGVIALYANHKHAFDQSQVNLLTTLASAMSVALENARLFDETQRLLKETEERNAELAIINSVQEGLVAKMDIQGIYDLVGDKIREIFNAQAIMLVSLDANSQTSFISYGLGKRSTIL